MACQKILRALTRAIFCTPLFHFLDPPLFREAIFDSWLSNLHCRQENGESEFVTALERPVHFLCSHVPHLPSQKRRPDPRSLRNLRELSFTNRAGIRIVHVLFPFLSLLKWGRKRGIPDFGLSRHVIGHAYCYISLFYIYFYMLIPSRMINNWDIYM